MLWNRPPKNLFPPKEMKACPLELSSFSRWKGTCGLNHACSIVHESWTRMKQHLKLTYPHCTIKKVYCHPRSAEQKTGHLFVFGFYLELIDSH
jgi:hypothetical protein